MKVRRILLLTSVCISLNAEAASISIDGNLADWGLHRNGNSADWRPNSSLVADSQYTVEDQTGYSGTRLFPGYGGQAYDAEAFYITMDSTNLYLALVTGLSPNTPNDPAHNSYGPGDFAIDFGRDGTFEFGVETTGSQAGSLFRVSEWEYGVWDTNSNYNPGNPDSRHPTSIKTGSVVSSLGQLIYNSNPFKNMGVYTNDNHYAIEASIPLIAFSGFSGKFDVHWTMNCANDAISVDPELRGTVPEPNSVLLLTAGILGLLIIGRNHNALARVS
jgi:hypothetical protein